MEIAQVIDTLCLAPPAGVTNSPELRAALVVTVQNILGLRNSGRAPTGALRTIPPALAHKLTALAYKQIALMPASPNADDVAAADKGLYVAFVEHMRATYTPMPLEMDMDKPALKAEMSRMLDHVGRIPLIPLIGNDARAILGTNGLAKEVVRALFVIIDDLNMPALRLASESIRAGRGMSEEFAPKRRPTEVAVVGPQEVGVE